MVWKELNIGKCFGKRNILIRYIQIVAGNVYSTASIPKCSRVRKKILVVYVSIGSSPNRIRRHGNKYRRSNWRAFLARKFR